jgi:hypothetical protein
LILIKGILKTCTPFMIGSGEEESSDSDVLRDRDGNVYIPGTSLAGVSRHFLETVGINTDDIFGKIDDEKEAEKKTKNDIESKIKFFDAFAIHEVSTSVRDSVRLVDKISLDGSKFDYEIAEAGAEFIFKIKLDLYNSEKKLIERDTDKVEEKKICSYIINGFRNGDIRIGSKTTRGFGVVDIEDIKYLQLDLTKAEEMETYINLDRDWNVVDKPFSLEELEEARYEGVYETIERDFSLKSFLFIRDYGSTKKVEGDDSKFVDAQTLTNAKENPVIPGPSIAGVIRSHCRKILDKAGYKTEKERQDFINDLFGYETDVGEDSKLKRENEKKIKSNVLFKECELDKENIVFLNRTRTAVDRFSGSALQTGALFTGNIACRNDEKQPEKITISIKIKKDFEKKKDFEDMKLAKSLINTCLDDLGKGLIAFGGNTGIGAGIFEEYKGE